MAAQITLSSNFRHSYEILANQHSSPTHWRASPDRTMVDWGLELCQWSTLESDRALCPSWRRQRYQRRTSSRRSRSTASPTPSTRGTQSSCYSTHRASRESRFISSYTACAKCGSNAPSYLVRSHTASVSIT